MEEKMKLKGKSSILCSCMVFNGNRTHFLVTRRRHPLSWRIPPSLVTPAVVAGTFPFTRKFARTSSLVIKKMYLQDLPPACRIIQDSGTAASRQASNRSAKGGVVYPPLILNPRFHSEKKDSKEFYKLKRKCIANYAILFFFNFMRACVTLIWTIRAGKLGHPEFRFRIYWTWQYKLGTVNLHSTISNVLQIGEVLRCTKWRLPIGSTARSIAWSHFKTLVCLPDFNHLMNSCSKTGFIPDKLWFTDRHILTLN